MEAIRRGCPTAVPPRRLDRWRAFVSRISIAPALVLALALVLPTPAQATLQTVSEADAFWHNADYSFYLRATSSNPLDPIDYTDWRFASHSWNRNETPDWSYLSWDTLVSVTAPSDHSHDGENTVSFFTEGLFTTEETQFCSVKIDTAKPSSTASSGSDDLAVWHNHPVRVYLDGSDPLSGVKELRHALDGGAFGSTYGSSATVNVSTQGDHFIQYYARDNAGNQEPTHTVPHVKVDLTRPTTTATGLGGVDLSVWHDHALSANLSAVDLGGAGVSRVWHDLDNAGPVATAGSTASVSASVDGDHVLGYYAEDAAGNVEAVRWVHLKVDMTSPNTVLSGADGTWSSAPATVTLTASDECSGIDRTFYRLGDLGDFTEYDAAEKPVVSADGITDVWYYSTDVAGNAEAAASVPVRIDSAAPTTVATLGQTPSAAGWYTGPVTATFSAGDVGSGVAGTYYRLGGSGTFAECKPGGDLTITAAGTTSVHYYSTDFAGNVETPRTFTVRIDATAPATRLPAAPPAGWSKTAPRITLLAADALSGVAATEYRVGAAPSWTPYGAPFLVTAQGTTTWQYRSTDKAGNTETARSFTVMLDSRRPTTRSYTATVKRGKKVKLGYRVNDPSPGCGKATVTLKIYKGKKLKKTIKVPGTCACNVKKTRSWKCTLPRGRYTVKVHATDIAGNVQRQVGRARLTVK